MKPTCGFTLATTVEKHSRCSPSRESNETRGVERSDMTSPVQSTCDSQRECSEEATPPPTTRWRQE